MISAYVLIRCKLGYEQSVINNLHDLDMVTGLELVNGVYDIVVWVNGSDKSSITKTVLFDIRAIPHVTNTLTLIVI